MEQIFMVLFGPLQFVYHNYFSYSNLNKTIAWMQIPGNRLSYSLHYTIEIFNPIYWLILTNKQLNPKSHTDTL